MAGKKNVNFDKSGAVRVGVTGVWGYKFHFLLF